jgi:hypothetical protein
MQPVPHLVRTKLDSAQPPPPVVVDSLAVAQQLLGLGLAGASEEALPLHLEVVLRPELAAAAAASSEPASPPLVGPL